MKKLNVLCISILLCSPSSMRISKKCAGMLWLGIGMLLCSKLLWAYGFQIKEKACGGEGMLPSSYLPAIFRVALLPDLVVKTPSNGSLYSNAFVSGVERAYGEALCNGSYLSACKTCYGCLTFLKDHVLQYCNASTQVLVWAHECFIHYDTAPF